MTIEIPGKNLVKYEISDDKRCQDQEYRHSSIYVVNVGSHKKPAEKLKPHKLRSLSSIFKGRKIG